MKKPLVLVSVIVIILVLSGCSLLPGSDTKTSVKKTNPASENCFDRGGNLEIRKNESGGKFGVCVFDDGTECEEWAFFHGLCKKGESKDVGDTEKITETEPTDIKDEASSPSPVSDDAGHSPLAGEGTEERDTDFGLDETASEDIIVDIPSANQQLSSPFEVIGQAKVFENVIHVDITTLSGTPLIQQTTTAKSPDVGKFGNFKQKIFYEFSSTKEGYVEVYSTSARDGSKINTVRIPVKF